jgi:hypothetical protein
MPPPHLGIGHHPDLPHVVLDVWAQVGVLLHLVHHLDERLERSERKEGIGDERERE